MRQLVGWHAAFCQALLGYFQDRLHQVRPYPKLGGDFRCRMGALTTDPVAQTHHFLFDGSQGPQGRAQPVWAFPGRV